MELAIVLVVSLAAVVFIERNWVRPDWRFLLRLAGTFVIPAVLLWPGSFFIFDLIEKLFNKFDSLN